MSAQPFDQRMLRDTLGRFATGITIITTMGPNATPVGLTANSFAGVSLDPPLVMWCLARTAMSYPVFADAEYFAVNILRVDQREISTRFARPSEDKFAGIEWHAGLGEVPVLPGALACFECRTVHQYAGGDHVIFVGAVERLENREGEPLLFNSGRYAIASKHPEDTGDVSEYEDFADLLL